jgi:hypothetical protein
VSVNGARCFALLALTALLSGCPEEKKPTAEGPAPSASPPPVLPDDAFAPVDPPRPAGDLQADLDAFTTVEACTEARAKVDPLVGDALDAIGYDTFLRDACRMLDAAKAKDATRCEGIDASSLRTRCRQWVAMAKGDADACPLRQGGEPASGREATCVAAALRSPALCAGEGRTKRAACVALVSHDAKGCDVLLGAERAPCVRDAERWRRVLVGDAALASVPAASGTLEVHGDGREDPAETKVDLAADVETGVVAVEEGPARRLTVGTLLGSSLSPRAVGPSVRTRFGVELYVMGGVTRVEHLELAVPGATTLSCPGNACDVTAKVGTLDVKRGGAVELHVEGTVGVAPQRFRIDATVKTWVRDVTTPVRPSLPLRPPPPSLPGTAPTKPAHL